MLHAGLGNTHEWLDNEGEILKKMPLLDRDNIKGWKAIFSKDGGWLAAAKAINAIGIFLKEQGVRFGVGRWVVPTFILPANYLITQKVRDHSESLSLQMTM